MAVNREEFERDGWANGLLGLAHDAVYEAQQEYNPESAQYAICKKLANAIEQADIDLENEQ